MPHHVQRHELCRPLPFPCHPQADTWLPPTGSPPNGSSLPPRGDIKFAALNGDRPRYPPTIRGFSPPSTDVHGLSYYSDPTLAQRLRLTPARLAQARRDLLALDLIAYDPPLYQVLSLPGTATAALSLARMRATLGARP